MTRVNRMDPILIMDDIIEKLHLLDYLKKFCQINSRKPLSRTYFAIPSEPLEPSHEKFKCFIEMCYWLMSLSFEDKSPPKTNPK